MQVMNARRGSGSNVLRAHVDRYRSKGLYLQGSRDRAVGKEKVSEHWGERGELYLSEISRALQLLSEMEVDQSIALACGGRFGRMRGTDSRDGFCAF